MQSFRLAVCFILMIGLRAGDVSAKIPDTRSVLQDSAQSLTLDDLYTLVIENHPVVKQAELLGGIAKQEIRLARGNFDPKLNLSFNQKEFTDKTYYSKLNTSLAIPTWIPINPKIGYERNYGPLLNNENYIADEKQLYAGVSVPLGRGLITDERRIAVRQAELFTTLTAADQVKMINKILLAAAKDYWHWYRAYHQALLSMQAVKLAEDIFIRTKSTFELGELSVLDTVQAKITLQTRRVELQESLLELQNARILISNYLWDSEAEPIQLSRDMIPVLAPEDQVTLSQTRLDSLVAIASENHPDLIRVETRINQAELDRKLAREFLKPQLDLDYALLAQPSADRSLDPLNDYKLGVDFSFPLFLRKERSKIALANFKISDLTFQRQVLEREIINTILTTFNELNTISALMGQQREMVELYLQLVRSEYLNLENGESDLFKINIQQEKLLQAQSKLLKLITDYHKQKAQLNWAAGIQNLGQRTRKHSSK